MEYLEETTKQKSQSHIQEKDEHEKFFDSLLPIVRQFDEDQSLTFRAEVIQVIQKIKCGPNLFFGSISTTRTTSSLRITSLIPAHPKL